MAAHPGSIITAPDGVIASEDETPPPAVLLPEGRPQPQPIQSGALSSADASKFLVGRYKGDLYETTADEEPHDYVWGKTEKRPSGTLKSFLTSVEMHYDVDHQHKALRNKISGTIVMKKPQEYEEAGRKTAT